VETTGETETDTQCLGRREIGAEREMGGGTMVMGGLGVRVGTRLGGSGGRCGRRVRGTHMVCGAEVGASSVDVQRELARQLTQREGLKRFGPDYSHYQRNLALELVRITEAAALAGAAWVGRGDKNAADGAAVDAMRSVLDGIAMDGVVVIGEGAKDEAPMLYCGERVGSGVGPQLDVAVDPLDGTSLVAGGRNGAVAVLATAERGSMLDPGDVVYMDKLVVGPAAAGLVDLNAPLADTLAIVAKSLNKRVRDLGVVILDRPRHASLVDAARACGARIHLISDGDVAASVAVASEEENDCDVLIGVGGAPEGIITAAAVKCMGGEILGRLAPRNDQERRSAEALGLDINQVYTTNDLCGGDEVYFAATAITSGDLLKGVCFTSTGAETHSLVMRAKSGTIRFIETTHRFARGT
jgi:fructose-1,6-bisphosphatase II